MARWTTITIEYSISRNCQGCISSLGDGDVQEVIAWRDFRINVDDLRVRNAHRSQGPRSDVDTNSRRRQHEMVKIPMAGRLPMAPPIWEATILRTW